jgi:serine/threonine-protein kinase RsbW
LREPDDAGRVSRNGEQVTERAQSLRIESRIIEIERASAWMERFVAAAGVSQAVTVSLLVALDEILNNIIRHGRRDGQSDMGMIQLDLCVDADRVALTVTDDGQAFDPTIAVASPSELPITARQPGGVGLLFVQSLMDEMRYARVDGCNRLVLSKRLLAPTG